MVAYDYNRSAIELFNEIQRDETLKPTLNQFGQIFTGLEGLKEFVIPIYNNNFDKIHSFREAMFYNELVQIQVFFEFIKDIQADSLSSPNLYKLLKIKIPKDSTKFGMPLLISTGLETMGK